MANATYLLPSVFFSRAYSFILPKDKTLEALDKRHARSIQNHLLITLLTSCLMWAYAICALLTIDSPIPGLVGIACSTLHLLSPLLFRYSSNIMLATVLMLAAGFIHQATFSFYSGGFHSSVLIWFGLMPMLAGLIEGLKAALVTGSIACAIALSFFGLELRGFIFPYLISETGMLWARAFLVFGWIGLSTLIITNYSRFTNQYESGILRQKDDTQSLLQILLHDISNKVQALTFQIYYLDQERISQGQSENTQELKSSLKNINSILQSVRKMHLLDVHKKQLHLAPCSLDEIVSTALAQFEVQAKLKSIQIKRSKIPGKVLADKDILENQVLVNLISNAMKFSENGAVIDIYPTMAHDPSFLELNIEDHGIGIPENILKNLFNLNAPTSRTGTAKERGAGLGMLIAKSSLEKMKGAIQVVSQTKKPSGTKVTLRLLKVQE